MLSPMRTHRARIAAGQTTLSALSGDPGAKVTARPPHPERTERAGLAAAALNSPPNTPLGRQRLSALLAAAMEEDARSLKSMSSVERKEQFKRDELLPRYREQIRRLTEAGQADPAIGRYLVWCFDAGAVEEGLALARWCLEHGQGLPEGFRSSLPFFLCSQILGWAALQQKHGRSAEPYFGDTLALLETENWDLPDKLKAEFYKLRGLAADAAGQLDEAVASYEKSLALGGKVETRLKEIRKKL